jgi:hypothetical protein
VVDPLNIDENSIVNFCGYSRDITNYVRFILCLDISSVMEINNPGMIGTHQTRFILDQVTTVLGTILPELSFEGGTLTLISMCWKLEYDVIVQADDDL